MVTWVWRAIYRDGSQLDEYDASDGHQSGLKDVRLDDLAAFALLPAVDGVSPVVVQLDGEQRLIFTRTHIDSFAADGTHLGHQVIAIVGWWRKVGGRKIQSLLACYENGAILAVDDRSKIGAPALAAAAAPAAGTGA